MIGTVVVVLLVVVALATAVVTLLKAKWGSLVVGLVFTPVWWVASARLARPKSWWAGRYYGDAKVERARRRASSRRYRAAVAGGLVISLAASATVAGLLKAYRITASSMEPTLHCAKPGPPIGGTDCSSTSADRVIAVRYAFGSTPSRGAIVAYRSTATQTARCNSSGIFIHRVVGLPGDTVVYRRGLLEINGKVTREGYVDPAKAGGSRGSWRVQPGEYFLMGDNRVNACDSRVAGPVPRSHIVGRVFLRYWPLGRIGSP